MRKLHDGPGILILPNVWDVASARVIEEAPFPALATTSAGIAASLGYCDGQHISRDEMLQVVKRIVNAVKVPVTADVEAGYGSRPQDAAETAKAVMEVGAVGMNLEDSTGDAQQPLIDMALQAEKIQAVRKAAEARGIPLVLNARTDVFLLAIGNAETRLERAVERLRSYSAAGASCLFAPGVRDMATVLALVRGLKAPLNILVGPGSPTIPELQRAGVARVSLGSSIARAALTVARNAAQELLTNGTYSTLEDALSYAEVNHLLERRGG